MSERPRDDLARRLDELEETLEALREEVGQPRESTGGSPSLQPPRSFRPPRPREFLRFTDEYAIPAAIAVLEANVRGLELLRAGIRVSDPERAADEAGRAVRDRASDVSRATLDRLDRALVEIESAMSGPGVPRNAEARELLDEARRLNGEIRERVSADDGSSADEAVRIDVESELESIRDEVSSGSDPVDDDEPTTR